MKTLSLFRTKKPTSEDAREMLRTILDYQLANGLVPYAWGPHRRTGGDYAWAHWMIALMYAERAGLLARKVTIRRISKLLDAVDRLPKFNGWLYKGYDLKSLQPAYPGYGFQPFYMMSLILAGKLYPEIRPISRRLLAAYDYSKSYDPASKCLSDYDIESGRRVHPIPLDGPLGRPAAERRLAYVVYSYLTGDISPWLISGEPNLQELGGHRFMAVSEGFNFDICHMHLLLPEIGYYERSWEEFLAGTASHMEREGLDLFPVRSRPLEEGYEGFAQPNIEHHQSMPYLTWYWEPNLPLMEQAFCPKLGFLRWNDHWRFYWSTGGKLLPSEGMSEVIELDFPQCYDPICPEPTRVMKFRIFAAAADELAELSVTINGKKADSIQLGSKPAWYEIETSIPVLERNRIVLRENKPGSVNYFRYAKTVAPALSNGKELPGIAAEVLCNGPYIHSPGSEGSENALVEDTCTALSVRLSTRHHYCLWEELLDDPRFTGTMVNWVGPLNRSATIGQVVYNVGNDPVEVEYLMSPAWSFPSKVRVENASSFEVNGNMLFWKALPQTVYKVSYLA